MRPKGDADQHGITYPRRPTMKLHILCLPLSLLLVGSHVSWAQLYRYQIPDGRWIISDIPPADDAEVVTKIPVGSGPSMQSTVQVPSSMPQEHRKSRKVQKRAHRQKRHQHRDTQPPRAVDTHQFGLLKIGSSKAAILRALGPPSDKVKEGKKKRMVSLKGRYIQRNVKIETWYYPGSNRLHPTRLVFYDGLLGEKDKGGY
jgi:hypothetical protein